MRWWICLAALVVALPAYAGGSDGVEISRSAGKPGGAVVLWPRIVPETQEPEVVQLAAVLQQRLEGLARRVVSDTKTLVRPAPERACPVDGCKGVSVSAFIGHQGGGCVVVAFVGPPGTEPTVMVPWAGTIRAVGDRVAFRQPPEAAITVTEFVPCGQVLSVLDDAKVEAALRGVTPP